MTEENVTDIFHNLHIQHSFVSQENDESCYIVMRGEENLSASLINDALCLENSTG